MRALIAEHGSWALSAATLGFTWLVGRKARYAFLVGLVVQALWLTWILATKQAGFLPLTVALVVLYVHNHRKWNKQDALPLAEEQGWVVADAQGTRFRGWEWGPSWEADRGKALHFARRYDAEVFCEDDEDAWRVLRVPYRVDMGEVEARRLAALYSRSLQRATTSGG